MHFSSKHQSLKIELTITGIAYATTVCLTDRTRWRTTAVPETQTTAALLHAGTLICGEDTL